VGLARDRARRARALGESQWMGPWPKKMRWMARLVPSWQGREKKHGKTRE